MTRDTICDVMILDGLGHEAVGTVGVSCARRSGWGGIETSRVIDQQSAMLFATGVEDLKGGGPGPQNRLGPRKRTPHGLGPCILTSSTSGALGACLYQLTGTHLFCASIETLRCQRARHRRKFEMKFEKKKEQGCDGRRPILASWS